jgi:hypothetical protein
VFLNDFCNQHTFLLIISQKSNKRKNTSVKYTFQVKTVFLETTAILIVFLLSQNSIMLSLKFERQVLHKRVLFETLFKINVDGRC